MQKKLLIKCFWFIVIFGCIGITVGILSFLYPLKYASPLFFYHEKRIELKKLPHPSVPEPKKKAKTEMQLKGTEQPSDPLLNISHCNENPNTPDFVAKQLKRATGHEDDPCAKVKWHIPF